MSDPHLKITHTMDGFIAVFCPGFVILWIGNSTDRLPLTDVLCPYEILSRRAYPPAGSFNISAIQGIDRLVARVYYAKFAHELHSAWAISQLTTSRSGSIPVYQRIAGAVILGIEPTVCGVHRPHMKLRLPRESYLCPDRV